MAFVRTENWAVADGADASVLGAVPAAARMPVALLLSGLVHLFLIWMLATRLVGSLPEAKEGASAASPLSPAFPTIVQLDRPAAPADPPKAAAAAAPPMPRETPVEASAPSPAPPPEWRLVRIPAAAAPPPRVEAGGTAGPAAGGGGEAPYDPFAGAAALVRPEPGRSAAAAPPAGLDRAALDRIVAAVARAVGGAGGTVELMLRVSADGRVAEARPIGGSAPARVKAALASALLGQALFRPWSPPGEPRLIRLPPVPLAPLSS